MLGKKPQLIGWIDTSEQQILTDVMFISSIALRTKQLASEITHIEYKNTFHDSRLGWVG